MVRSKVLDLKFDICRCSHTTADTKAEAVPSKQSGVFFLDGEKSAPYHSTVLATLNQQSGFSVSSTLLSQDLITKGFCSLKEDSLQ